MAKSYIDAEKLIAEIERWRDKAKEKYNKNPYSMGRCDALAEFRNHIVSLQQEQPVTKEPISHLEHWLAFFGCPEENIEKCATQIAQGYGAIRYLEGVQNGAEAVNELAQQEQPEVDLEGEVEKYFGDYWKTYPLLVQRELINFARTFVAKGYILARGL